MTWHDALMAAFVLACMAIVVAVFVYLERKWPN